MLAGADGLRNTSTAAELPISSCSPRPPPRPGSTSSSAVHRTDQTTSCSGAHRSARSTPISALDHAPGTTTSGPTSGARPRTRSSKPSVPSRPGAMDPRVLAPGREVEYVMMSVPLAKIPALSAPLDSNPGTMTNSFRRRAGGAAGQEHYRQHTNSAVCVGRAGCVIPPSSPRSRTCCQDARQPVGRAEAGTGARPDLSVASAWLRRGGAVSASCPSAVPRLCQSSSPAIGLGHVRTSCAAGATGARLISLVTTSR